LKILPLLRQKRLKLNDIRVIVHDRRLEGSNFLLKSIVGLCDLVHLPSLRGRMFRCPYQNGSNDAIGA
jgi:hypothetical protein